METILTLSYLIVFFGVIGGMTYAIDTIWQAHKRGMARVKAYDKRTGGTR